MQRIWENDFQAFTQPWVQPLAAHKPDIVAHAYDPSIQEVKARGSGHPLEDSTLRPTWNTCHLASKAKN